MVTIPPEFVNPSLFETSTISILILQLNIISILLPLNSLITHSVNLPYLDFNHTGCPTLTSDRLPSVSGS